MNIKYLSLLLLSILMMQAKAQEIKIGSRVPDILLNQMFRYKSSTATMSDFRGKFLLLDFWFTTCGGCIDEMPRLQSLQKQYPNNFQVLMVTFESKDKVNRFFEHIRSVKDITLPSVVADTVLRALFPHHGEPHEIWIDDQGIVRAITGSQEVTDENIKKFLGHQVLNLPVKVDVADGNEYHTTDPIILHDYNQNKDKMLYYSYLSSYQKGIASMSSSVSENKEYLRIKATNFSFADLYKVAYRVSGLPDSRVLCMFRDSSKYHPFNYSMQHVYCYDFIIKDTSKTKLVQFMTTDLDRFFGIKSSETIRMVKCLILRKVSPDYVLTSKGGTPEGIRKGNSYQFYNVPLKAIVENYFNYNHRLKEPVIDETGYSKGGVDFKINFDDDLNTTRKALSQYGLDLVEEERPIKVIVLEDQN